MIKELAANYTTLQKGFDPYLGGGSAGAVAGEEGEASGGAAL
jgi:hypothetical protein